MPSETSSVIECEGCQKQFAWKPKLAGKKGKCGCGTVVSFPETDPALKVKGMATSAEEDDGGFDIFKVSSSQAVDEHRVVAPVALAVAAPPPMAKKAGKPVAAAGKGGKTLAYAGAKAGIQDERVRYDPTDIWEGSKGKNLFLPLGMIVGGLLPYGLMTLVGHGTETFSNVAIGLAVNVPLMLIGCMIAARALSVSFGPVLPAILKLTSILLAREGVIMGIALVGALAGAAGGGGGGAVIGGLLGLILGAAVSIIMYWCLLAYFFGLDFGEVKFLVFIIWVLRTFVATFILEAIRG